MAHFAELDENNIVKRVIVVHNNECSINGVEIEEKGILFCKQLFGYDTKWRQTSYNGKFRKNYAGIGYYFDDVRNAFIPPKPFESWILNEETCLWDSPIPSPTETLEEGSYYEWDEQTLSWVIKQL